MGILLQATQITRSLRGRALREGLTQAQVDALPKWKGTGLFNATQEAVLAYCDAMPREIHVPAETFAPVRAALDERCVVELTATIGAYNMVSLSLIHI